MNLKEIRSKAKDLKVANYSRLRKQELIWAIQKAEGNAECFTRIEGCGQTDCCWFEDCQG